MSLNEKGKDLIYQYRTISAKLKKRFMKKPNAREASEEYGKLANSLKNDDNHEYAGICFTAMAKCDQLTGDGGGEAESWANAGRQFFLAEDQLYQARNVSFEEMLEAGIHCFLLAVHVLESKGDNLLAGSFAEEAGQRLVKMKHFSQASIFFQRAIDLQHQTSDCRLSCMKELLGCLIELREYSTSLGVLSSMISDIQDKTGPYSTLRKECEETQLLLILLLKPNKRQLLPPLVSLLTRYTNRPLLDDITDKHLLLHSLVISIDERDYTSIQEVVKRLRPLLNSIQQKILHVMYEENSLHHSLN